MNSIRFRDKSLSDKSVDIVAYTLVILMMIVTVYPFIYVFSSSLSSPIAVMQNKVTFFPVGIDFTAYKKVIAYKQLWLGYKNTVVYTVVGTALNMLVTALMAYPLSRKDLPGRKYILLACVFSLVFQPGLIPKYMVVKNMGLLDSMWALIVPTLITTTNLMIMKTFFESIPDSLVEAAYIDGATEIDVLVKIIMPLSKPALVSISLFYAVKHWNSYFDALIYISNDKLYPVQIFLRNIVLESQTLSVVGETFGASLEQTMLTESIKYVTIVLVSAPIIIVYPYIQKFFKKGVMIGGIKG